MILAGTGHRLDKLGGYRDVRAFENTVWLAKKVLSEMQPAHVISGMALGWDQALAMGAINLGIPFTAAVPYLGQERRWPEAAVALYRTILERAHTVKYVSEGGHSFEKLQIRNEWMVNNCDQVLALFNGSRGGTRNCILYAQAVGKPVINVWDRWLDLDQFV